MTRIWARAATGALVLVVAGLLTRSLGPVAQTGRRPAGGVAGATSLQPPPPAALTVAATFVVAVDTVDATHPHGDLTTLRAVADPELVTTITAAPPRLTATQLAAGTVLRARTVTVAGTRSAVGAVVTVTAALTLTAPSGIVLRTAVANTVIVTETPAGWRVSGVRS
jgi:hypothetical protein